MQWAAGACQTHVERGAPVEVRGPPRRAGRAGESVHRVILDLCKRSTGAVSLQGEQWASRAGWLGPGRRRRPNRTCHHFRRLRSPLDLKLWLEVWLLMRECLL